MQEFMSLKKVNRIIIFSPLPPPEGGIASWTADYLRYANLVKRNVVHINTSIVGKNITFHENRNVFDEIKRTSQILKQIKSVSKITKEDVVHYNTSCSLFGMIRDYLFFFKHFKKAKVLMQCHCDVSLYINSKFKLWVFKKVAKLCNKILVLNKQSLDFVKSCGIKTKVQYFPNFIDVQATALPANKKNDILNIAFVGHIRKEKGFDILVGCAKKYPQISFHVFGQKPAEFVDPELSNIIFHGVLSKPDLFKQLATIDVLLAPSMAEGFSISLLECLSLGLLVISSPAGASNIVLSNTKNIVTKDFKLESFENAIFNMLKLPKEEIQQCSIDNVNLAKKYDKSIVLRDLFNLYNELYRIQG